MQHALELTDADWDFNFAVNARGVFLANQIVARHFVAEGLRLASSTPLRSPPRSARRCSPIIRRVEIRRARFNAGAGARACSLRGIRVNAVCPGFVKTGMQARVDRVGGSACAEIFAGAGGSNEYVAQISLGRLETPEDVADVVVFLCSDSGAVHDRAGRQRHRRRLHDLRRRRPGARDCDELLG